MISLWKHRAQCLEQNDTLHIKLSYPWQQRCCMPAVRAHIQVARGPVPWCGAMKKGRTTRVHEQLTYCVITVVCLLVDDESTSFSSTHA